MTALFGPCEILPFVWSSSTLGRSSEMKRRIGSSGRLRKSIGSQLSSRSEEDAKLTPSASS